MVSLYVMSLLNKEEPIDILNLDEEGKKKETTKPDKKVTTSKTTGAAAASSVRHLGYILGFVESSFLHYLFVWDRRMRLSGTRY